MAITSFDQATLEGRMGKVIMDAMNKEIAAVAEPIMKKALEDIQVQMKQRMGGVTIALMERYFSVQQCGDELRILVQVREPKP